MFIRTFGYGFVKVSEIERIDAEKDEESIGFNVCIFLIGNREKHIISWFHSYMAAMTYITCLLYEIGNEIELDNNIANFISDYIDIDESDEKDNIRLRKIIRKYNETNVEFLKLYGLSKKTNCDDDFLDKHIKRLKENVDLFFDELDKFNPMA